MVTVWARRFALSRVAAACLAITFALAAVSAAPLRAAAADASLVVTALRIVEREYYRAVDPVALLNAAVASLRSGAQLDAAAVPDIPAGIAEEDAVRLFAAEFEHAEAEASAREPEFAYTATRAMLASLHDSHARFMSPDQYAEYKDNIAGRPGYAGIGIRTTLPVKAEGPFVTAVVRDSPAAAAGIERFDQILAVNGVPLKGVSAGDIVSRLRGPAGSSVMLRIRRQGRTMDVWVTRAEIRTPPVEVQMIRPGVAYIRIWTFSRGAAVEARGALQALGNSHDIHSIVLDLRGNPGGLVVETEWVAGIFVPAGTVLALTHSTGLSGTLAASGETLFPNVPLAVLVDRGSASGAEILTIGLRDANRALVIGETTAGAFGSGRDFPLPEGGMVITTRALTGPRDEAVEGIGIAPDRGIPLTVDDMLHGDDSQLDVALSLLGVSRPAVLGRFAA